MGRLHMGIIDHDRDRQTITFEGIEMTALNYDAQITAGDALATAVEGIIAGEVFDKQNVAERDYVSPAVVPSEAYAQVNIQWVYEYTDNVNGRLFTGRIGTADLVNTDTYVEDGLTKLRLDITEGAAFKTAFQAYVRSEDGNAVTLNRVYLKE